MTKPTVRRSDFAAWTACAAYENGPSEAANFGTLVHALIAAHWSEQSIEEVLFQPCGVSPERRAEAHDLFLRFRSTHAERPDLWEMPLLIETEHAILTGTPDAVTWLPDDAALVTDWKSSWVAGDATFQLRWYCAMLAVQYPALRTLWGRVDPIWLNEGGVVDYGPWDADELRDWWAVEIVAQVPALLAARANPEPTGGAACTYCRLRRDCAQSVAPARDVPQTAAEAAEMASELIRLEAASDVRKAALKAWFADREPVVVAGMEVGFLTPREQSFRPTADPLTIAEFLSESGLSGNAVLSLDRSKIGKPLQRDLVAAGLGEMASSKAEFKLRKAAS